ncbi:MAG: hypothetical protein JO217_01490 [Acidobacteriaceae bacterium]|nr:hypothetical protein [Acidobacteriaceae bacterium]
MKVSSAASAAVVCLCLAVLASAQTATSSSGRELSCKPLQIQTAAELTFQQRSCLYTRKLLAPSMALRAVVSSAYGQVRNSPADPGDGMDVFEHGLGAYYARRTGQYTGELMAGYLPGEDPRFHPSGRNGFWPRVRATVVNVVAVPDGEGGSRPAIAPIAGSLSSGLISVATYRTHNSFEDGFRRTGYVYSGYIGTALLHEFQPDLTVWANHLIHRKKQD